MANTTNIIPNKLTMYQRVEGGVWHYRIKLKTGEWYRLSSRETDFDEAKEIANRTYYVIPPLVTAFFSRGLSRHHQPSRRQFAIGGIRSNIIVFPYPLGR